MSPRTLTAQPDPLERLIRESGEEWLLDLHSPPEGALQTLRSTLQAVAQAAARRGDPQFGESQLIEEYRRNPHRVQAFLQLLGCRRSPDILWMAWRVIQGWRVERLSVVYEHARQFRLEVVLSGFNGRDRVEETYQSDSIFDLQVLRHFSVMTLGGAPYIEGLYALRIQYPR